MSKFIVSREKFIEKFIDPLSKLNLPDKPAQITLNDESLTGVSYSVDRHIMVRAQLTDVKGDNFEPIVLKDLNRLLSALKFSEESMMNFELKKNIIEYKDDNLKIKAHLMDDRFFDCKIPQKIKKVDTLKFDTTFTINQSDLSKIRKTKQFSTNLTKIYFGTDDSGRVSISRKDDEKPTLDTIEFSLESKMNGAGLTNSPISFDLFDLFTDKQNEINVKVVGKYNIFIFEIKTADTVIEYITSALRK